VSKKPPQFNKSSMRPGGKGYKYPAVDGYSGGRMDAPGASKSAAIAELKRSAGSASSQTIPGAKKTSREEKKRS